MMFRKILSSRTRWIPAAFLFVISCAGSASSLPQQAAGPDSQDWPKSFDARDSRIVVYEPQLESFKGSRLQMQAAVSVTRKDAVEPVFGGIWLDAVVTIDPDRKIVTPVVIKVRDLRFPTQRADEAARLRQDIDDEIGKWKLAYGFDDLLAEVKAVEERKVQAQNLKAEVPKIIYRSTPTVLLSIQDEPAWRPIGNSPLQRLENCSEFVVRDPSKGLCYLHMGTFWWTAVDPLGTWQAAGDIPASIAALSTNEGKTSERGQEVRPEVISVNTPTELVLTEGEPQFAPISGTELLYIKNTDSDVFLDMRTQTTYALFSGRWYRTPTSKTAWEFVASDQLPDDFRRIPVTSEKQHVLASVAGTAQAGEAVKNAEIPQTEAVKPGPAPDLAATYDGPPQFTEVAGTPVQYSERSAPGATRPWPRATGSTAP